MATFLELSTSVQWPERPRIMGIVNVTPDSFSDGGHFFRWEKAVQHGLRLIDEGADLLDVGGESTRPGAEPVGEERELERVLPVLRGLAGETDTALSIDTRHPAVAAAALDAGATWVNDVGGLRDPTMAETVSRHGAGVCIMHMQGEPTTMQAEPRYEDVVTEVCDFLGRQARHAQEAGIASERIWIDPGIGFGKTLEHNLRLMAALDRVAAVGYPVVLGASRKRFIEKLTGDSVDQRLGGSLAAAACARTVRPSVLRVHDVRATRQFLLVREAIEAAALSRSPESTS